MLYAIIFIWGCFLIGFTVLTIWDMVVQPCVTKLLFKPSALSEHLLKQCPEIRSSFQPVFWARNSHIQTILTAIRPQPPVTFKREIMTLEDGGQTALDWAGDASERVMLIFPGISGDANDYRSLTIAAVKAGFQVIQKVKHNNTKQHVR